jgi:hypothetical protein
MVDQYDRLCADSILLSLMMCKLTAFRSEMQLDRPVTGQFLSTVTIDILKMLPTAAYHRAIKGRLGFPVEASPVFPL